LHKGECVKVKNRILTVVIAPVTFAALITLGVLGYASAKIEQKLAKDAREMIYDQIMEATERIYDLTRTQHATFLDQLRGNLGIVREYLNDHDGIETSKNAADIPWQAVNQFTQETAPVMLKQLSLDGRPVPIVSDPHAAVAHIDAIAGRIGNAVTIFQRMNANGDMLRVATTVLNGKGQRAIGTFIPQKMPDGSDNPVIASVLKGETFLGKAVVVNETYLVGYEPLLDSSRQVIGMIFVGIPISKAAKNVRDTLSKMVIGKTGYAFVLGSKTEDLGRYIISKDGKRDGENILQSQDANGRFFVKEMIENGMKGKTGEGALVEYSWKNEGETTQRKKTAASIYFAPWDWVIGASAYDEEFLDNYHATANFFSRMKTVVVVSSLMVTLAAVLIGYLVTRQVFGSINHMMHTINKLATGDFSERLPMGELQECSQIMNCNQPSCPSFGKTTACWAESGSFSVQPACPQAVGGEDCRNCIVYQRSKADELTEMGSSLNVLADEMERRAKIAHAIADGDLTQKVIIASEKDLLGKALQRMIEKLNGNMLKVAAVSKEVVGSSRQVSLATSNLSQGASEQASAFEQISASMIEINDKVRKTAAFGHDAVTLADESAAALKAAKAKMDSAGEAMTDAAVFSNKITAIIKTIDTIAFQTNLLALNAAVEAARAGVHGKGFAVVAEEVRNLAGRSAQAAAETTSLISETIARVERGQKHTTDLDGALSRLFDNTQKNENSIKGISVAADEQAGSLNEIARALDQINATIQDSTVSSEEIASVAADMVKQAEELNKMVAYFKISRSQEIAD
jgi:methyl-accepting chemotaxis protein